jgi:acyl-CoA oxidase
MCTDEQYEKWVPKAKNLRIMGAYGQTELGHGSDIQGLETTAHYDSKTDEFIIHSPSIKAAKWWPGGIGIYCTHAIIFAKLILDDEPVSVVPFIVQLRDT